MDKKDISAPVEAILFAAGEPVSVARIAAVLAVDEDMVLDAAQAIADEYVRQGRGIRLLRLENTLQLCSAPEYADMIRPVLETRKPPQLSPQALEVLAITAYFQPVTRAFIEQVRGVDSAYTVNSLLDKGLIEACGTLDAPGRPTIFSTTLAFLRVFGISSLSELPPLPEKEGAEPANVEQEGQLTIEESEQE